MAGAARGMNVRTRFVVDATGRSAWFARRFGAKIRRFDPLAAIVGQLKPTPSSCADNGRLLIEAIDSGWWYSVNLATGYMIAAWISAAGSIRQGGLSPSKTWQKNLVRAPHTAARRGRRDLASPVCVTPANSQHADPPIGKGWVAVGDAAQAYDPLSSTGISNGLRHGLAVARAIASHLDGYQPLLKTTHTIFLAS